MGLYDDVKCKYKLPGATNEVQKDVFQTKDLGSMMDSYTITEDGELLQSIREYYGYLKKKDLTMGHLSGIVSHILGYWVLWVVNL